MNTYYVTTQAFGRIVAERIDAVSLAEALRKAREKHSVSQTAKVVKRG